MRALMGDGKEMVLFRAIYKLHRINRVLSMRPKSQLRPCSQVSIGMSIELCQDTYLQETVDEVVRQPSVGFLFCAEVLENVVQLFPIVEGFLLVFSARPSACASDGVMCSGSTPERAPRASAPRACG
jgi:hypothetical protein